MLARWVDVWMGEQIDDIQSGFAVSIKAGCKWQSFEDLHAGRRNIQEP